MSPLSTATFIALVLAGGSQTAQEPEPGVRIIVVERQAQAVRIRESLGRGERFEDLAERDSLDTSAVAGGFLGRVAIQDLREEYRRALTGLVPDEVSEVVSIDGRFAILKLLSEDETALIELSRRGIQSFVAGRYEEAEEFLQEALARAELFGPADLRLADSLNDYASFCLSQGRHAEAERHYLRALDIQESVLGPDHLDLVEILGSLADLYMNQGRRSEAEPLLIRAVEISEAADGLDPLALVSRLNDLAHFYGETGRYRESDDLYTRALEITATTEGRDHPSTAVILDNFAQTYSQRRLYAEAEILHRRAFEIFEDSLGPGDPNTLRTFLSLATVYAAENNYARFRPLVEEVISAEESVFGPDDPRIADTLEAIVPLLQAMGREEEAAAAASRAARIRVPSSRTSPN